MMGAILAIDGGGTRTRAGLYDDAGNLFAECEGEATNLSGLPASMAVRIIGDLGRSLVAKTGRPISAVVAGISGAGRTGQAQEVATGLAKAFGTDDVRVCSDAHMLSFANLDAEHPILVIAGTGSAVITRRADGSRIVTGGWGPVLGDEGGAYRIALEGIRNADEDEELKIALVEAAKAKSLPNLYRELESEEPTDIARLASIVTRLAESGNRGARVALRDQAQKLAALARRGLERAGIDVSSLTALKVYVTGGTMDSPLYAEEFLDALLDDDRVVILERPKLIGHQAALALRNALADAKFIGRPSTADSARPSERVSTEYYPKEAGVPGEKRSVQIADKESIEGGATVEIVSAILAIDGGGTRTRAGLYDEKGNLLAECEGGPINISEVPWRIAVSEIAVLGRQLESRGNWKVSKICAGLTGAGMMGFGRPVADELSRTFGTKSVFVANDLYTLFIANCDGIHPLLVTAGAGSSVMARHAGGSPEQLGGLGPILGDEGSAYSVAIDAIRHSLQPRVRDEHRKLMGGLIDALGIPSNLWLFPWVRYALREEIAALAVVVTDEANRGDIVARNILSHQAGLLADLTLELIPKAQLRFKADDEIIVLVSGEMFQNSDYFQSSFLRSLRGHYRKARLETPKLLGHKAAFQLYRAESTNTQIAKPGAKYFDTHLRGTEGASNERPLLDELLAEKISRRMTDLELASTDQFRRQCPEVGEAISAAAACLRAGGRIIYAGAGTSGRLGVLDASECPPTFGVDEGRVIGLIAGGDKALRHSIEGAEDGTAAAVRDIDAIKPSVGAKDIVIGITASGTTPYALAAIDRAKALGAKTGLVCCNPVPLDRADIVIALDTGPEVLPGSTRLKAGTATKMVLNQISTGAMAKAGYVFEGRMVGVAPSNKKLRQRCIRIVAELTKEDEKRAEQRLDETGGSIRLAVLMARRGLSLDEARRRLDACRGVLRDALDMS